MCRHKNRVQISKMPPQKLHKCTPKQCNTPKHCKSSLTSWACARRARHTRPLRAPAAELTPLTHKRWMPLLFSSPCNLVNSRPMALSLGDRDWACRTSANASLKPPLASRAWPRRKYALTCDGPPHGAPLFRTPSLAGELSSKSSRSALGWGHLGQSRANTADAGATSTNLGRARPILERARPTSGQRDQFQGDLGHS